jgi:hypothetical protein
MSQTLELTLHLKMDDVRDVLRAIAASDEPEREVRALGVGLDGLAGLVEASPSGILSAEPTVWDATLPLVLTYDYESVGEAETGLLRFSDLACRCQERDREARIALSRMGFRRFSVALALLNRIKEAEVDWTTAFD